MTLRPSSADRRLIMLFASWRVGLIAVAWIAGAWFPPAALVRSGQPATAATWLRDVWLYWDGTWFERIARLGYAGELAARHDPVIFDFFPLYPWLGGALGHLLGNQYGAALLLISNGCLLASCLVLYRLARLDGDEPGALRSVEFLLAWPFAFFLGAAYGEPLVLLALLLSFLAARRRQWAWCGAWGGVACLARHISIVALPALAVEYWMQERRWNRQALWLLLIPLGMALYFLYLQVAFGDALWFFKAQPYSLPHRTVTWKLWQAVTDRSAILLGQGSAPAFMLSWAELLSLIAALAGGGLAIRRLRPSYGVYCILSAIPPLISGTLMGMTRYDVLLFPLFILLGGRGEETPAQQGWRMASLLLLAVFTMLFTRTLFVG